MSRSLPEEVTSLLSELIHHLSGLDKNSEAFRKLANNTTKQLQTADSMVFLNRKQIDDDIEGLSEKYNFHGFCGQANDLQKIYSKYVSGTTNKEELTKRLTVVKFLMCMSERPTEKLVHYQKNESSDEEEEIDWPKYLQEGIPRWSPHSDAGCSSWSDSGHSSPVNQTNESETLTSLNFLGNLPFSPESSKTNGDIWSHFEVIGKLRQELLSKVQHTWFNQQHVRMMPESNLPEANAAIRWENHLDAQLFGLTTLPKSSVISEYKIIREIIWELFVPHSNFSFRFHGDKLVVNPDLTIASVRKESFQQFMQQFLSYIETLQMFRDFHRSVEMNFTAEIQPPNTYRGYDDTIQSILHPIYIKLAEIEYRIQKQETTDTLMTFLEEITDLFRPVVVIKKIHEEVVSDWKCNSALHCATTLLTKLQRGFLNSGTKLEQDLYLTLFLGSLNAYFAIMDKWLTQDVFTDYGDEFVIKNNNPKDAQVMLLNSSYESTQYTVTQNTRATDYGRQDWQMQFFLAELDDSAKSNNLINVIATKVLSIAKNVHLLNLLDKLDLVFHETSSSSETLYEEFVNKVIWKIAELSGSAGDVNKKETDTEHSSTFKVPFEELVVNWPGAKSITELDKLVNLVDTSDVFLMEAFRPFFQPEPEPQPASEPSLYERVKQSAIYPFCGPDIIANTFSEILNKRFTVSGILVRDLLVKENKLEKQFEFLKHVFLFKDDFMFNFYRQLFRQMDLNKPWGNSIWLTSHLQDLIMDSYPEFYERISVQVVENWKSCKDPLKACGMINIRFVLKWPSNIVIRDEHLDMYKEVFKFVMKIKWALYTLNHLYFDELNPKVEEGTSKRATAVFSNRLKLLRFHLLATFSNIQNYVFGYVFHTCCEKFKSDFKKSNDMDSLIDAHQDFISSIRNSCVELRDYQCTAYGFHLLVYLVMKLRLMWKNGKIVNESELNKMEVCYKHSFNTINSLLLAAHLLI